MDNLSVTCKSEGKKINRRSAVIMGMLEWYKKSRNDVKESINKVISLHTKVQHNEITTLDNLENYLAENKMLGHSFFTN